MAEHGDGPNHHAFGTFVMPPADSASRAGVMPKASGDPSSRTFGKNMDPLRSKEIRQYEFPTITNERRLARQRLSNPF